MVASSVTATARLLAVSRDLGVEHRAVDVLARAGRYPPERRYADVNDELRSVFIHIPKTGGVTVKEWLYEGRLPRGHAPAFQYRAADPDRWRRYYTFALVRSPLDRFLSAYDFLDGGGMEEFDRSFIDRHLAGVVDADDFVVRMQSSTRYRRSVLRSVHFISQTYWVATPQSIVVDYIGRYEEFETSLSTVARVHGRTDAPTIRRNRSERRSQLSPGSVAAVRGWYQADYVRFGYP